MKSPERDELELVRSRQQRLRQDLDALEAKILFLEKSLREQAPAEPVPAVPAVETPVLAAPPVIRVPISAVHAQMASNEIVHIPAHSPAPDAVTPEASAPKLTLSKRIEPVSHTVADRSQIPPLPPRPEPAKPEKSFELRLGTYWFVRVGIVLLLTSLAFFGNYAYQNFIFKMPPGGKVAMLYVVSGLLLGAGLWLRRKGAKETLANYAQVLFAGGLAAVYFTTYAAHHVERLRVIQSPLLDGALLLAWAGFIVFLANRNRSEILGLFALGLAYYTATITRTGSFTLYSNLVLTAASVFFLWRNSWAMLSTLSLPATYFGYAFWRFYAPAGWHLPAANEGLLFSACFLGAYWLVFTAAVFLGKHPSFNGAARASFATFNNGAALALFLLTMAQLHSGGLWKVCLGFGAALLVLAFLSRKWLPDDPIVENSYLAQGLALVTAGFIAKFAGMDLSLLLAAESVVTLVLATRLKNRILRGSSWVSAALAVAWAMDAMEPSVRKGLYLGCGVALGMLVNALVSHKQTPALPRQPRAEPTWFSLLLLITVGSVLWNYVQRGSLGGALIFTALVCVFSIYLLGIPELVLMSQALVVFAHVIWVGNVLAHHGPWDSWIQPALMFAATLVILHWWERQKKLLVDPQVAVFFKGICAACAVAASLAWIMPGLLEGPRQNYVAGLAGIVVVLTFYAFMARSVALGIAAQAPLLWAVPLFIFEVLDARAPWQPLSLLPLALLALPAGAIGWLRSRQQETPRAATLLTFARGYAWTGLGCLVLLIACYVPARHCPWVFALLSCLPFAMAASPKATAMLPYSAALMTSAAVAYFCPMRAEVWAGAPSLLFIALLAVQQLAARRLPARYPVPELLLRVAAIVAGLALWLFVSSYVRQHVTGFFLTVAWSVLALVLFVIGMGLRERSYRWVGLTVLGFSLGRIVIMDVWKLESLYRILSFMALGIVLLLLGYIYNRFQEKIKEWL